MSKFRKLFEYYVRGEYHCDTCPFSWDDSCAGCEDCDCGCYIYGDLRDTCRLLPPFRFLLGWGRRKKARYYENHQYDDFEEWYLGQEKQENALRDILKEKFPDIEEEIGMALSCTDLKYRLQDLYAVQPLKLRQRWEQLIKDTTHHIAMWFVPYFKE